MIHRCAIDLGASRRGRRSQEDPTPARQVNTPTQSSKHTNRERDGGDAEEDWRTMTVRALLVNVLMTNNFSHSIFLHHPRGQRG